ncbi:MAG: trypsin-like peptidase domain-containing protein [Verrucomicrobiae bacterium]|nr:trypsin-like peptidase domain-containing protein [Verrucomicrobiae bacterium]
MNTKVHQGTESGLRAWRICRAVLLLLLPALSGFVAYAAERGSGLAQPPPPPPSEELSTAELAARARDSLVVIGGRGRDGSAESIGTGFVIDASGLIATSLHVVGEGRPVSVRLTSGAEIEVIGIHAFDRRADLAILRVDPASLAALPLGDSAALMSGAEVVALGNPMGLEGSVVAGVLSGRRTLDSLEMLQIAMPIEPGNSGGPLLDRQGRVQGIVNAKSLVTRNLGFATPVNDLKALLERPNPVPMARWVRTGVLDPDRWDQRLGAQWRQRAGALRVEGLGAGFGGRAFLLSRQRAPEHTFELTVTVRLEDESGAAGLLFAGTEDGRHYGFYPTAGQLRLTAFEGPDILSWRILGTVPSTAYRPGDWNTLRVRYDRGAIQCQVNGAEVFAVNDTAIAGRSVGLAKFRNTVAEFRGFACADSLETVASLDPALISALATNRAGDALLGALRTNVPAAREHLSDRARALDREAAQLRALSDRLHRDRVRDELVAELGRPESAVDLPRAALLVAWLDNSDLDVAASQRQLDALGVEVRERVLATMSEHEQLDVLRKFLFEENGFHGSRHDYHHRANSYLNEVIEDREGLPITLSIVFMALAERSGVRHVSGLPLPGHFLVRHAPPGEETRLVDVFDGGRLMSFEEANALGSRYTGLPVRSDLMGAAGKRDIIRRLLGNLQSFTERDVGAAESLRYMDLLVAIAGSPTAEAQERIQRARLRSLAGDPTGAREDLQWIVDTAPPGIDVERVAEFLERRE